MHISAICQRTALLLLTLITAAACGLSDTPSSAPTSAPPDPNRPPADIHWETWQGVRLPFGGKDGPTRVAEAALGYSHTPQGAALAAIHHTVRISLAPDATWSKIAAQTLVPGPGKDEWVLARARISVTQPASAELAPRIAAYRFTAYAEDRAQLLVYSIYSDNSISANTQTVVWSHDDWRLLLPDPALKSVVVEAVPDIPADAVRLPQPD
ncbi:hypothetical protein [Nocardia otitidiscaviarum]|uniref:hypothetical protein n=1 Tax=Nocardia otitidiscaviarum TaxID=1823 RepID=UPI002B4B1518|nr:hypothetical protein [Nocardia otitidiscaviarum]